MANPVEFLVGVVDFRFVLGNNCANDGATPIHAYLSFSLTGDFLPAAMSDALCDTVDYDSLCRHLQKRFSGIDCSSLHLLTATIRQAIFDFSPLISGGSVKIVINCHDTFIVEQHLL